MNMLTVFTIPKAFKGHIKTIQLNAIGSWLRLKPPCEVLLFGNEDGTAEAASQLGVKHIPEIECSDYGTPLISCAFRLAQKLSTRDLFCYVNADVILVSDFVSSLSQVEEKPFLVVGRRWDVNLKDSIDFSDPSWESKLLEHVHSNGVLHGPQGLDYFVFPRGLFEEMPPFLVGRVGWDNWMVLHARLSRVAVIDATRAITAIHQNHDYSHLPDGEMTMRRGIEAQHNLELLGGRYRALDVRDATYILTPDGVRAATGPVQLRRRLETSPELYPNLGPLVKITLAFRALLDVLLSLKSKLKR
jgi:hypothetical protein